LHFVKVVGTHLHVDPVGQFSAAAAKSVIEISDAVATNPATTSKDSIRCIAPPIFPTVEKLTIVPLICHLHPSPFWLRASICGAAGDFAKVSKLRMALSSGFPADALHSATVMENAYLRVLLRLVSQPLLRFD
jgi:hypothetical protein